MHTYDIYWHAGWWLMLVVPVLSLVVLGIFLLRDSPRWLFQNARDHLLHHETAAEILDKRYARGEITREQYDEMHDVLERRLAARSGKSEPTRPR